MRPNVGCRALSKHSMRALFKALSFILVWTCNDAAAQDACLGDAQATTTGTLEERFSAARAAYDGGNHREAAVLFRQLALEHSDYPLGEPAASLYLDSLNRLFQAGNAACAETIAAAIDPLNARYCVGVDLGTRGTTPRTPREELCRTSATLYCDLARLRTETLARERRYFEAHTELVRLAREHTECGRVDEMLYNAALYAQAARQPARAVPVFEILVRNFPQSALAKRAIFLLGATHHGLAQYEQAAAWYERFAREFPGEEGQSCSEEQRRSRTCPIAHEVLQNAIFFRLGLGQIDVAIDAARTFERNYARRMPDETASVAFSILSAYERTERWRELAAESERVLAAYPNARPEIALRARLLAALGHRALGRARAGEPHLAAIVEAWRGGVLERIPRASESPDAALALARAKDVIARAIYLRSDAAATALLSSSLAPPRSDAARWTTQTFASWITEQERALDALRGELERVAPLEIPEWQIAASERIGSIEAHIADQISVAMAALPESSRQPLELAFDRYRRRALDRYGYCATVAIRVRWPSEASRRCNEALSRLDPRAHPIGPFELLGEQAIDPRPAYPAPVREGEVVLTPRPAEPTTSP